jgi:ribosomal protein S18 acetylase RimI-like enzyme
MSHARVIRLATQDDTAAIVAVCTRAARLAYADLVTPDYLDRVVAHFYNADRVSREVAPAAGWFGFVVVQDAAGVIGVAGTGRSAERDEACELFTLYVDPDAQRQGVGRALVARSIAQAGAAGATHLDVAVMPGNTTALRFYAACGFTLAGERAIYAPHGQEGGPAAALVYTRPLQGTSGLRISESHQGHPPRR